MHLPHEEYIKSLPKKIVAAGALFFDEDGKMLIVKPNYREHWNIPGGVTDQSESPQKTCEREIMEEIGLARQSPRLVCVGHSPKSAASEDYLVFIFYGGILSREEISKIRLQEEELSEYDFKSIDECVALLGPGMARRIPHCLKAIKENSVILI